MVKNRRYLGLVKSIISATTQNIQLNYRWLHMDVLIKHPNMRRSPNVIVWHLASVEL